MSKQQLGQALVEYLLVMIFMVVLTAKMVGTFSGFMGDSFGNLSHVLSLNLTTGICQNECWFSGYYNRSED